MNRNTHAVLSVLAGVLFAAVTYVALWRSATLAVGVFVAYSFGAWALADTYGEWPDSEGRNWLQASFPAFAMTPALIGLPASLPPARRAAIGLLVARVSLRSPSSRGLCPLEWFEGLRPSLLARSVALATLGRRVRCSLWRHLPRDGVGAPRDPQPVAGFRRRNC